MNGALNSDLRPTHDERAPGANWPTPAPWAGDRTNAIAKECVRPYPPCMRASDRETVGDHPRIVRILALDGVGGLVVGALLLVFLRPVAAFYGLSLGVAAFVAAANVAYGSYSSSLAYRAFHGKPPSRRAVDAIIVANATWTLVCGSLLVATWGQAGVFGQLHIGAEGLYVLVLAGVEARFVRPLAR